MCRDCLRSFLVVAFGIIVFGEEVLRMRDVGGWKIEGFIGNGDGARRSSGRRRQDAVPRR